MRNTFVLIVSFLLVPLAGADAPAEEIVGVTTHVPGQHITLNEFGQNISVIKIGGGDVTIYVSLCAIPPTELTNIADADGIHTERIPEMSLSRCLRTGLYQESNTVEFLQTQAGTDGAKAWRADARLIA